MTTNFGSYQALRSEDFVQSIGVSTHLSATTTSFGNVNQVIAELSYLGIEHVRDRAVAVPVLAPYIAVGQSGIKFDLIVGGSPTDALPSLDALAPYIDTIEGPNEVDRSPVTYNGVTGPSAAVADQAELYKVVHADPILNGPGHSTPVLAFSFAPGTDETPYGNISAYADYSNVHAYGSYGGASHYFIAPSIARETVDAPNLPVVITETGNFTMPTTYNGVTQDVQAKLEMTDVLLAFKLGVTTTYLYELSDTFADPNNLNYEDHWGMFNADGTPKLAATAFHNLLSVLSDSAATSQTFTAAPLTYGLVNMPYAGNELVLEKSNGAYDIALWQEPEIWNSTTLTEIYFASTLVTVNLGRAYQTINVYDPLVGSNPIATYHNVSSIQVALNTGPLIVEVEADVAGKLIATGTAGGVFASTGVDTVVAGSGAATVNVSGTATITGSTGTLAVNFTGSKASLTGGAGALTVVSNSGNNTVTGGAGAFSYTDAAGNDVVTTGTSANNKVVLGSGSDTVKVLGAASVTGGSGAANITLTGVGASVTGGSGALTVNSLSGSSTVTGGTGAFSYTDAAGNDLVTTGKSASNSVVLGSGSDTVSVLAATLLTGGTGASKVTLGASGSFITGGAGVLTVTDNKGANTITGGAGALAVTAYAGGDAITTNNTTGTSTVILSVGNDTVLANGATNIAANTANLVVSGPGPLSVNGGMGAMTVNGGTGSDYVFTQAGTKNLISLGSGAATVLSHGADTINASTLSGVAAARIYAAGAASITGGAGALIVNGQGGPVTVKGGTGAVNASTVGNNSYLQGGSGGGNVLNAAGGNSTLVGGGAGDRLSDTGSAGGNVLTAGAGGATLAAGSGNDTLAGGSGADVFVLAAAGAAHSTVIQGYVSGSDHLSFTGFGSAAPIASQQVVGGNLQLTLADHAAVTLLGVTQL